MLKTPKEQISKSTITLKVNINLTTMTYFNSVNYTVSLCLNLIGP